MAAYLLAMEVAGVQFPVSALDSWFNREYACHMNKMAIIVVDVQNDFVEGGSLAVAGGTSAAQKILSSVRHSEPSQVYFTKDWHIDPGPHFSDEPDYIDTWPRHCVAGTEGANFAVDFSARPDRVFHKGQYAASYSGVDGVNDEGKGLVEVLRYNEIEEVRVLGIALDYCVRATALDLHEAGFKTRVYPSYTASVHPESYQDVIDDLTSKGIYVTL